MKIEDKINYLTIATSRKTWEEVFGTKPNFTNSTKDGHRLKWWNIGKDKVREHLKEFPKRLKEHGLNGDVLLNETKQNNKDYSPSYYSVVVKLYHSPKQLQDILSRKPNEKRVIKKHPIDEHLTSMGFKHSKESDRNYKVFNHPEHDYKILVPKHQYKKE